MPEGVGGLARALGRADAVRGRRPDPDGQQRLGTTGAWPGGGAEELLWLGLALEWPAGSGVVLDLCHVVAVEAQSPEMAIVVLRAVRGGGGQGPGGYPTGLGHSSPIPTAH